MSSDLCYYFFTYVESALVWGKLKIVHLKGQSINFPYFCKMLPSFMTLGCTNVISLSQICPTGIHLFKVNNGNTKAMYDICYQLTKTPDWRRDVILVSLLLTMNRFHTLPWCFHCWLWASKFQLGMFQLMFLCKTKIRKGEKTSN